MQGDQYVVLNVRLPRDINEQQRRLLTAQFGPREVESLAMNAVLPLQSEEGFTGTPLRWVQERELKVPAINMSYQRVVALIMSSWPRPIPPLDPHCLRSLHASRTLKCWHGACALFVPIYGRLDEYVMSSLTVLSRWRLRTVATHWLIQHPTNWVSRIWYVTL